MHYTAARVNANFRPRACGGKSGRGREGEREREREWELDFDAVHAKRERPRGFR